MSAPAAAINTAIALALAALAYFALGAIVSEPWPLVAAVAVFILYWVGVAVIVIDFDWFTE